MAVFRQRVDVSAQTTFPTNPQVTVPFEAKKITIAVIAAANPVEVSFAAKGTIHGRFVPASAMARHEYMQDARQIWVKADAAVANTFVEVIAEN